MNKPAPRAAMPIVTLDYETHYSAEYSLSRMSPLAYVMDKRFQTISCSIKVDNHPTDVFFGDAEVRGALQRLGPTISKSLLIAHNMSGFDAYVCAYRHGVRPKLWGCTMAMARPIHAKTVGLGLAKLVAHYRAELEAMGFSGVKNNAVLVQTRGKRLEDFTPAELAAMGTYNRDDTDQCYGLFKILRKHFTPAELWQIDALTRMRTEPAFELDVPLLETAASVERSRKHKALLDLARILQLQGVDWDNEAAITEHVRSEMASAPKFAALLTSQGVAVPMKHSPTDESKLIPALAKTDEAFLALQESDNAVVAAAARTRLDVKSTLLETRIQKFLEAGAMAGGVLPVPIKYCGADTSGRDSGEEYNCQNLPRVNRKNPRVTDALRKSLRAPAGKKVIVADQSGIELRVNHFLWQVPASMALYQADAQADLYKAFAAVRYAKTPEEITAAERHFAKLCQLGLGFGSGATTFQRIAQTMGGLTLSEEEAKSAVQSWRGTYAPITEGWKSCARALRHVYDRVEQPLDPWGLVTTTPEGLLLPSGRLIRYPDLREEDDGEWPDGRARRSWFYAHGRHKARITGPKCGENCVQALARDSIFDCTLEYFKRTGLRPALRVHDELVYVVDAGPSQELLDELQAVMRTPPTWWPELVVWSEGDTANNYGDAK